MILSALSVLLVSIVLLLVVREVNQLRRDLLAHVQITRDLLLLLEKQS